MIFKTLFAFTIACLIASPVGAIELSMRRGNATSTIVLTGSIDEGDAALFKFFWDENAYDSWNFIVAMDSPGGNLWEGIEIGTFIREMGVKTQVQKFAPHTGEASEFDWSPVMPGGGCFSACALAFMGGVEREISEDAEIGFHQFSSRTDDDAGSAMVRAQSVSAVLSSYLRSMGAAPELFEMMSMTAPSDMFVPRLENLVQLGIVPSTSFNSFKLFPKDGIIVASATNPRNPGALERVLEIETMCWKGVPIINLYTKDATWGLNATQAGRETTHIDGFSVRTDFGDMEYSAGNLRLYGGSRILASLTIEPHVARALGSGNSFIVVNSYTASGIRMSGEITAPSGGDPSILASFKDCI